MPEIAEVARITHFLRLHLVGKKIAKATAVDDQIVYGKVGTTGAAFEAALKGKTVVSAANQGKYFWHVKITLDKPPHPVMHFGMTGWIHINGEKTAYTNYYKKQKPEDRDQWPPRFWKFQLETAGKAKDKVEVAFTDPRRLGRIRLVDCPGPEIRKHTPLVENGPDPVVDPDIFTEEFLAELVKRKRVPIKSLLLDQANISGIGNWVGDEVLYHARIHPEQYSNEIDDDRIKDLYDAIYHVCQKSCDVLGDSDQFPEHWLFHYRWGKGKSGAGTLPSGEKLEFATVGGRTSCFCPARQKKGVAKTPPKSNLNGKRQRDEKDVKKDDDTEEAAPVRKKKRSSRGVPLKVESEGVEDTPTMSGLLSNKADVDKVDAQDEETAAPAPVIMTKTTKTAAKKGAVTTMTGKAKKAKIIVKQEAKEEYSGRRRSLRLSKS
ncbi:uncharacterized protein MKZ38_001601 [Zalerion maritima]|uniref:Formamidopyrimidine-DNA glycosylase catalytic domain-containing protein n=1 Tax=Zalerion maritima TaxID=339359 RepID=A0AAD5WRE1_9PEZI|nr:uncharacterized protein MKZ38_001601 [Zalerion maritima]